MWILTDVGNAVNLSNADFINIEYKLYNDRLKDVFAHFNNTSIHIKECESEDEARLYVQQLYNEMLVNEYESRLKAN